MFDLEMTPFKKIRHSGVGSDFQIEYPWFSDFRILRKILIKNKLEWKNKHEMLRTHRWRRTIF